MIIKTRLRPSYFHMRHRRYQEWRKKQMEAFEKRLHADYSSFLRAPG